MRISRAPTTHMLIRYPPTVALSMCCAIGPRKHITAYSNIGLPISWKYWSHSSQLSGSMPPSATLDSLNDTGNDVSSSPSPTQLPFLQSVIKFLSSGVSSLITAKKLGSSQAFGGASLRKSTQSWKVLPVKGDFHSLLIGASVPSTPPSVSARSLGGAVSYRSASQ